MNSAVYEFYASVSGLEPRYAFTLEQHISKFFGKQVGESMYAAARRHIGFTSTSAADFYAPYLSYMEFESLIEVLTDAVTRFQGTVTEVGKNFCWNPSFEYSASFWVISGGVTLERSNEWSNTGEYSGKAILSNTPTTGDIRAGSTTQFAFGTLPNKTYYISAVVNLPEHETLNETSSSRQRRLLLWDVPTGNNPVSQFGPQAPNTEGVHTLTGTLVTSANSVGSIIGIGLAGSAADAGKIAYIDSVYISEIDGPYYDGDTPDALPYLYRWIGTPGSSASMKLFTEGYNE